jgi:hypothetical protein
MSITKDIVWSKLLAMKDEEVKVVKDRETAEIIEDIIRTREPFDNGFIISMQDGKVHKSYFILPAGCQYCANSIWADYFLHLPKKIL